MPVERFIRILLAHSITILVDIRRIPWSRHNPQFNSDALEKSLKEAGIGYAHLKELGGLRRPLKGSENTGWRNLSFRGYADYMQTKEFKVGLDKLIALSRDYTAAIMCAEGSPFRCHRSLVADALTIRGVQAVHISSEQPGRLHVLTSFAVIHGQRISYVESPVSDINNIGRRGNLMPRNKDPKAADASEASSSSRADIVRGLNEDLAREYKAIIQYVVFSAALKGAQYEDIAEQLKKHASQELAHALEVARQIDYLGGEPTVRGKQAESSKDSKKMLEIDLKDEQTTIKNYRERIRQAERAGEFALSEALRDIIAEEQDHEIDLRDALGQR